MGEEEDRSVSSRGVAKGTVWAMPTLVIAAAAPAVAVSAQDVVVAATPCSDGSGGFNNIPFTVTTSGGATLPVGTVFTVKYAGGSTRPTWSGR